MSKLKFLLIVFVFVLPFIFAKYFFDNDATSTRGTTNHGSFLVDEVNFNFDLILLLTKTTDSVEALNSIKHIIILSMF